MGKVPVYGVPILNKIVLLRDMLRSFDHDVSRLFIVDNGGLVGHEDVAHFRADNVHIADPGFNMGVAGSWNFIIRANLNADWWLLGCNDMKIAPGAVGRLVEDMEAHAGKPHMARMVMGNEATWGNHFGLFGLTPEAVDMVGWFDENIYPIYFEDNDYMERIKRAEPHGFSTTLVPSATHHGGNASWKDSTHLSAGNKRTWSINGSYYESKWHSDTYEFDFPFDIGEEAGLVRDMDGLRYFPQPTIRGWREQDWHVDRRDNVKNDGIIQR